MAIVAVVAVSAQSVGAAANDTAPTQKPRVLVHPVGGLSNPPAFPAQTVMVPGDFYPHPHLIPDRWSPRFAKRALFSVPAAVTMSGAEARFLLRSLVGANPEHVYRMLARLPENTRNSLKAVIAKAADPSSHVTIAASFLAAYADAHPDSTGKAVSEVSLLETAAEAAADAQVDAVVAAEAEAEAQAETEAALDAEAMTAAAAEMEEELEAEAELDADAEAEIEADEDADADADEEVDVEEAEEEGEDAAFLEAPAVAAPAAAPAAAANATNTTAPADGGVGALTNLAAVLATQASTLEATVHELEAAHKPNIFQTLQRGPVGRRPTAPKDRFPDTGVRSWEAQGRADILRQTGARPDQIDKYYSVEPLPTGF